MLMKVVEMKQPDKLELVPHAQYVGAMRDQLPPEVFEPARSRVLLVPIHLAVIAVAILAIGESWVPWFVVPVLSLVIGISFASLTFVGHETVHGGVVRGRRARHILGWVMFLPFTLSPRLWAAWHDRVHHSRANVEGDPDAYPTLDEYRTSRRTRFFINAFAIGGGRWRGVLSLVFGFTGQSGMQLLTARRQDVLKPAAFAWAIAETLAGVAVWTTVAVLFGGVTFVFVYVIPLLVANMIVMAFILTNHGLSPRVELNDPLVSGLSVTAPRWIEWMTLKFGYHVEHHLFPAMSSRHARTVRELVRERWPTRYQSMPLLTALSRLHHTARVYRDPVTLIDPSTGREYPTLMPS